jgi:hypothetical protein
MRLEYFLVPVLLLTACGGRSMNSHLATKLIMEIPQETLEKKDIEVVNIIQVSGSEAIADTTLKTAFRLEKVRGKWAVREVRLGHGQWEKVSDLVQTLEVVKIEETRQLCDRIAEAIRRYQEANGALPVFKNYIGLSDLLSPTYLTPLIRLDAWNRPFEAERTGSNTIVIRSAGPDGRFGTKDDIIRTFPP